MAQKINFGTKRKEQWHETDEADNAAELRSNWALSSQSGPVDEHKSQKWASDSKNHSWASCNDAIAVHRQR